MRPEAVARALERLAKTRDAVEARSALAIAEVLGRVGERFRDPDDPLRRDTLAAVADESGLSGPMVRRVVRGMARDWTRERLAELLVREFGDPAVLDGFVPDPRGARWLRAVGDPVAVHIGSGSVPGVSTTSLIRSLLVKTPVLIKPGGGDRALTEAFRRGLAEVDPELAASAEVAYWPGSDRGALEAAVAGASRIVAYGSDAAVAEVRRIAPVTTPMVLYHHRFSVAIVGTDPVPSSDVPTEEVLARAVSTFDQRGCVSPHRVYLVGWGAEEARVLGERLAGAMESEARAAPPSSPTPAEAARLQQLRGEFRMRSAVDPEVAIWASPDAAWTVVVEPDPGEGVAGHPRTVVLVPVPDEDGVIVRLRPLGAHLQSVGLTGWAEPRDLVDRLAGLGVTRIVPLEALAFPPAWWMHDGTGPLRALVRWVEWERGSG